MVKKIHHPQTQKVSQKKRAERLFFSLKTAFAHGESYLQTVPRHAEPFEFHTVVKNGKRFRIAWCNQPHLVTILCFDGGNAWWERLSRIVHCIVNAIPLKQRDPIAMEIYGGKLCPQHRNPKYDHYHHFYNEVFDIKILLPTAEFMRAFPFDELCAQLGITAENADYEQYRVWYKKDPLEWNAPAHPVSKMIRA